MKGHLRGPLAGLDLGGLLSVALVAGITVSACHAGDAADFSRQWEKDRQEP